MPTPSPERVLTPEEIEAGILLKQAEAAKMLAEAELAQAEIRKREAETDEAICKAQVASIDLAEKKRDAKVDMTKHEAWLACDFLHHVYQFTGSVDASSVKACMAELAVWHRTDPSCDMEIVFHSPGGSVIDGMALFDYILGLRADGHHITTVARGYAASMAGILLQAGNVRRMGPESYLLIHEVSFGASGKIGEVEDEVKFIKMIQARVLTIFAERSTLTKKQIQARWSRQDWWIDSDAALKLGLIDEIA